MIIAQGLSKFFGRVRAVDHVSFEVPTGQIVGLLGPNGAGKTTTIRMITGFTPPTTGSVSVCGHDTIRQSVRARQSLGYLPDSTPLYPEMRAWDYLNYRAKLLGVHRRHRRARIEGAMERCRIADVRSRRIGQLSKGYRQRVGLASTLLHDPPVLILDEPTTGLDPSQIRETRGLIRDLAQDRTVLVSSHILPEVERTCDRVIIIARGRIMAQGTARELLSAGEDASPYIVEAHAGERGAEAVVGLFSSAPDVARVERAERPAERESGPWVRLLLHPAAGSPDLREAIARAAAGAGVLLRELHRERPSLESLFIRIVEGDAAQQDAGGDGGGASGSGVGPSAAHAPWSTLTVGGAT